MSDETTQKLGRLEGKMEAMSEAIGRIESVIQRIVGPIDKGFTELAVQFQHLREKVQETREATLACNEEHREATEAMSKRVTAVHEQVAALDNKSTGALRMALWFCAIFSGVAIGAGAWLFNQVGEDARMNAVQQQRIEQLERDVAGIRQEIRSTK